MHRCCKSMNKPNYNYVDKIGIFTSGVCALHCLALPLLLSFGIISSFSSAWHDLTEFAVIVCSCILGIWSIFNALKNKVNIAPQLCIVCGAIIIVYSLMNAPSNHFYMAIGGCLLLLGHWQNWRLMTIGHS